MLKPGVLLWGCLVDIAEDTQASITDEVHSVRLTVQLALQTEAHTGKDSRRPMMGLKFDEHDNNHRRC